MVRVLAPAKLNLGLRILDRRPDGYHEIETVFVPLHLCDEIEIEPGAEPGVQLRCNLPDLVADERNLVVRAALATCDALGVEPSLRVSLHKRIPVAAGLGGGSSDAAATIRGIESLLGRQLDPGGRRDLARQLGADVPFFLDPRPALGRGIGEILEPIEGVPELAWILVAMPFEISTAEAYRAASAELTLPQRGSSIAALLGPRGVSGSPSNDLEAFALRKHPEIRWARDALVGAGARVTGMSGSGPTVYGHFPSPEVAGNVVDRIELPAGATALVATSAASGSWTAASSRAATAVTEDGA